MANVAIAALPALAACVGAGSGNLARRLLNTAPKGVVLTRWWCEVGVAVLWLAVTLRVVLGPMPVCWVGVPLLIGLLAVVLSACDIRVQRLPDIVTLPAYPAVLLVVGVAAYAAGSELMVVTALFGGVLYTACYASVRLIATRAMGAGDVKLAGSLGMAVGAVSLTAVVLVIFVAAVLTVATALASSVAGRARQPVPHGPAMLVPAWLVTAFPAIVPAALSAKAGLLS